MDVYKPFTSVAKMALKDHSKSMDIVNARELGAIIRKTNYNLGTSETNYITEASARFINPKNIDQIFIDKKKLDDMRRRANFKLGFSV